MGKSPSLTHWSGDYKVQRLANRTVGIENIGLVVRRSREVRIGEGYSAKRCRPQDFAWRRLAILGKREPGLRIDVGVPPEDEYVPDSVEARIDTGLREHLSQLLAGFPRGA